MRFLLEGTSREQEIPELARKYAENVALRTYERWRPSRVRSQEVRGIEWLQNRDQSRATVLGFLHHHHYEGMFASIQRHGVPITVIGLPDALSPDAPVQLRQHIKIVASGCNLIPAVGGTQAVIDKMQPGVVMGIASDVIGQTEVEFLGRKVKGSFGAARIATITDSPVVLVTAVREGSAHYLQVHEPLEPKDFATPADLLAEMLRVLGDSVLAWPEVLDTPLSRFGAIDG